MPRLCILDRRKKQGGEGLALLVRIRGRQSDDKGNSPVRRKGRPKPKSEKKDSSSKDKGPLV